MIHACPTRKWYVDQYLIPSMLEQGIPEDDIQVWEDTEGIGNLESCMCSFASLPETGDTWHLQDDVVISKLFAITTEELDPIKGIMTGFCSGYDADTYANKNHIPIGHVTPDKMWYSFCCIRIPNIMARQCADWYFNIAKNDGEMIRLYINGRKNDDMVFRRYLDVYYNHESIYNLVPNLVDHVDYLLGGSLINKARDPQKNVRSVFWEDKDIIDALERKINGTV